MNLGDFIDTFRDAIAQRVVESYPPLYRPLGERRHAPQAAPQSPGGAGRRHQGRGPLAEGPPGNDGGGRDGNGQDVQCAALRGIGYPAQSGRTRRKFLGQPTHLEAKA